MIFLCKITLFHAKIHQFMKISFTNLVAYGIMLFELGEKANNNVYLPNKRY